MVFPGVLRGLPGPRLATTPTNRPRRSLSSPGVSAPPSIEAEGLRKTGVGDARAVPQSIFEMEPSSTEWWTHPADPPPVEDPQALTPPQPESGSAWPPGV